MEYRIIFHFIALAFVVIVPGLAAGESTPVLAADTSFSGRNGGYARRLPRRPQLQETIENDMQQSEMVEDQEETATVKTDAINSGFVIFDGRYVPPPYAVRSDRGTTYVNGLKVPQRRQGPFFRRPMNNFQPNRRFQNRGLNQIEQHLRNDGLLICSQSSSIAYVSAYQAVSVFEILLGEETDDAKVQKLMRTDTPWIDSDQWASLIEAFDGPAELSDRVQALKQRQAELAKDDTDFEPPWLVLSGITFSGFILAVLALGTLMNCRPPMLQSSRATVLSKRACRQVVWLVVLISVLNMYDLTCTLFAHNAGGLWELNPFVSPIIQQNSVVVVFKLCMTVGAAILLLVTRRHRLTQIGSWWAGVLYTVLILRWTMFNSMFL